MRLCTSTSKHTTYQNKTTKYKKTGHLHDRFYSFHSSELRSLSQASGGFRPQNLAMASDGGKSGTHFEF